MLFLIQYTLEVHRYPDTHERETGQLRLVEADDESQAIRKLEAAVTVDDPYAYGCWPEGMHVHPVIK